MNIAIHDEISQLESIIIHEPGNEMNRMHPVHLEGFRESDEGQLQPNPDYLLFDDLVYLPRLRAEHAEIVEVLRATCGHHNVHRVGDLLRRTLHDPVARAAAVDRILFDEAHDRGSSWTNRQLDYLRQTDPDDLLRTLFRGTTADGTSMFQHPLPNLMFARDLGAVVGSHVLLTYARHPARKREMTLARTLFTQLGLPIIDIGDDVENPALEGGDILFAGPNQVLIGVGERTAYESAAAAAARLNQAGIAKTHLVFLRVHRSTMHLDTAFTFVSHDACLVYAPQLLNPGAAQIVTIEKGKEYKRTGTLLDVMDEEGIHLDPISCGGADPVSQAREQWSDGANAFALAPGRILLYARNEQTLRTLNAQGFQIVSPQEFCRNAALFLQPGRRLVIAIEGYELSRGRGGPRCLTLPLRRANP
ncbi:MAG: arginine deiminase family protein [Myxococcota bacterium]|nr:arginine deiminase family protein [Myxococcota bacterium]